MQAPSDILMHRRRKVLELRYPEGRRLEIPAELLRVYSPSAEVRGHGEGQRTLQTGKKHVNITDIELVGNYALRLVFDDGHDTGIYTWQHLADLGRNQQRYWDDYMTELKKANASRLPAIGVGQWQPRQEQS